MTGMGFVLTPPHVALCAIARLLTSYHTQPRVDTNSRFVARLVQFVVRQRYEATSLRLPSLTQLLTLLQNAFGEQGSLLGDYCRDRLSRLTTVTALGEFFYNLKQDLQGRNGVSLLLQSFVRGRHVKIGSYSPVGLFLRECIAAFEDLKFEQVCELASEMSEFSPSMLDQAEPHSQYLADRQVLERHYQHMSHQVCLGKAPTEMENWLNDVSSLTIGDSAEACSMQHEMTALKKDISEAIHTLHKYCGHLGSSVGQSSPVESQKRLFVMSLRMASLQSSFDHIEASRLAVTDAFKMIKKRGDEKAMVCCLVLLVQILLHSYQTTEKEISLKDLNRYIERCFQKSKQLKLPHMLGFSALARAVMALQYGLIQGQPVSCAEVHRLVLETDRNLRLLRDYVASASAVLNVNRRPLSEDGEFEAHKLFLHTLNIMEPGTKRVDPNILSTMDQLVAKMQLYVAQSWKRMGCHALSALSALSIEAALSQCCTEIDRAEAIGYMVRVQSERKGFLAGRRILEAAQTYTSTRVCAPPMCDDRLGDLKDAMPLMTAEKEIQLQASVSASLPGNSASAWPLQYAVSTTLAAWDRHRAPCSTERALDHGSLLVEAAMAMGRESEAETQIGSLISLSTDAGTSHHSSDLHLLYSRLDAVRDQPDVMTAFLGEAGALLEDAECTSGTVESTLLYCKALLKWNRKSSRTVEELLTALLPFVLSECSLRVQFDVVRLLLDVRLHRTAHRRPDGGTQSLLEHTVRLAGQLGNLQFVEALCHRALNLFVADEDVHQRLALLRRLKRLARECGAENAGMTLFSDMNEDAMDID